MTSMQWGREVSYDSHGIAHLRTVTGPVQPEEVADHLTVPGPYHRIFWARLGPGGFIIPHIDSGPFHERWHIPVEPAGWFWEETRSKPYFQPEQGVPFEVRHWKPHAVWNDTDRDRIHLIVDRLVLAHISEERHGLVLTEMIPEIQEMIDKLP